VDGVVQFLRARRWARITILTVVPVALAVVAVGLLGYPLYTNLYQDRLQNRLKHEIASAQMKETYQARSAKVGDPLTRIVIPSIKVDVVVVEGTTASALRAGAGHYPNTPLPCEAGNVAIAGHRTTYGKPFANVDLLKVGDTITLETPIGVCTYQVSQAPFVTLADGKLANGASVIDNAPGQSLLTLTSCHPKGSASHRMIIRARLVQPKKAA
jgi:sortase A